MSDRLSHIGIIYRNRCVRFRNKSSIELNNDRIVVEDDETIEICAPSRLLIVRASDAVAPQAVRTTGRYAGAPRTREGIKDEAARIESERRAI